MKLQNEMLWEKPGQSLLVSLTLLCSPGNNAEQQIKCLTTHNLMLHLQSAVKRKKKRKKPPKHVTLKAELPYRWI